MSLWTLTDAAVRATALLGIAGALAFFLRHRCAALRHAVWALGLGGALAMPLSGMLMPSVPMPVPRVLADALPVLATDPRAAVSGPVSPTSVTLGVDPAGTAAGPGEHWSNARADLAAEDPTAAEPTAAGPTPAPGASEPTAAGPAPASETWSGLPQAATPPPAAARTLVAGSVLLTLWGLGAGAFAALLLAGAWSTRRLARDAAPVRSAEWTDTLRQVREGLGVRRPVRLLRSGHAVMPMTWGWRRPVVLVPAAALAWSSERRAVVLRHELAHVRRGDVLTQLLARWTCAVYWFNPMVWFAAYRLRMECERACDDAVLRLGTRASDYASHLLDIARDHQAPGLRAPAAVAMARTSRLEGRMRAILDPKITRAARRSSGVVTAALLAAAALAVSAATPVAQDRAAPPAPIPVGGQGAAAVPVGSAGPGTARQAPGAGQPSSPIISITGTMSAAGREPGAGQPASPIISTTGTASAAGQPASPIRPGIVLDFTLPSGHRPQIRGPEGDLLRIWLRDAGRLGFVTRIRDDAQQVVTVTVFDLDTTPHRELGAIDVAVGEDPVTFRTSGGPFEIAVPRIVVYDPAEAAAREAVRRAEQARAWLAVAEDMLRTIEPERARAQARTRAALEELQQAVALISDRLETDETAGELLRQFGELQEHLTELEDRLAELQLLPDR